MAAESMKIGANALIWTTHFSERDFWWGVGGQLGHQPMRCRHGARRPYRLQGSLEFVHSGNDRLARQRERWCEQPAHHFVRPPQRYVAAGCDEVGFVILASDTFSRRNQGTGTADGILLWHEISRAAAEQGIKASVMISAACGCPFEGVVPTSRILEIAAEVVKSPSIDLAIADTIGVGVPNQVTAIVEGLRPLAKDTPIRAHFHNTRNTAIANIAAAVQAGATIIDASTGGIGGCPFAPKATGNVATEDVLYLLQHMGIETGISLEQVIETAGWLETQLGRPVPGMVSKAGDFPSSPIRDAA